MKRILAMVLVGVIGISAFTGCGKSEEEKANDEIAQHLRDEAAADGVDIDKMVEEEAEKYNAEVEAGNKKIANENEFKESLKNNEIALIKEKYEIYLNATDSETAKKAAEEFNKAYDEYLNAAIGEYISELGAYELLKKNDIYTDKITDSKLQTRVMYLDNCYEKDYDNIVFFENNSDDDNFCILMYNKSGSISDLRLVYPDGRMITPDLSTLDTQITSAQFVVKENSIILTNHKWAYEFTTDNPTGETITDGGNAPIYPEGDYKKKKELWENTIEDFNRVME